MEKAMLREELELGIQEIERLSGLILKTLQEKVFRAKGAKEAVTIESLQPVEREIFQLMGILKENTEYLHFIVTEVEV